MQLSAAQDHLILIVDDTLSNLQVISETLSDEGFEVSIATSGERALEQVQHCTPDLILLDIMMPGIGGFETCKRIKIDEKLQDVPVIFMTALADLKSKVEGFSLGAVDYITKPFQEEEVLARVKTHLSLRKTQLQLQASENRLNNILSSLKEVVWSAHLQPFELLYLNPAAEVVYGVQSDALRAEPQLWFEMIHPDDRDRIKHQLLRATPSSPVSFEYRIMRSDAQVRWLHCQAQASLDEVMGKTRLDGIVQDISERKQAEHQLRHTAQHDSLTNLANRAHFMEQLEQLLGQPRQRSGDQFAVLFIDLDRFKAINDSLGHGAGDQLLVHVANLLKEAIRPSDIVARLGGDEFTILLQRVFDVQDVIHISERIQEKLKLPIVLSDYPVTITASIGIVMSSTPYHSAEEILRDADIAMYQAKNLGKACHQLFSPEMYEQEIHKLSLEGELRKALKRQEFFLTYQPIKQLETNELAGFEALVRWQHPERGLISPGEFIPLAEETGLIVSLGDYVLREACAQMRRWQQDIPGAMRLTMSVNLSSRQLQGPNFLETLGEILAESQLQPSNLKLEITESLLMENSDLNLHLFQALQQRGIRLSLDDFGTGYSSLSYLHKFPINTLKIDRSFIQKMEPGVSSFEIVRTITALARTLKMDVVAEGVETAEQAEYLKSLSCEMVQGYFFSKPLEVDKATSFIRQSFQSSEPVSSPGPGPSCSGYSTLRLSN